MNAITITENIGGKEVTLKEVSRAANAVMWAIFPPKKWIQLKIGRLLDVG